MLAEIADGQGGVARILGQMDGIGAFSAVSVQREGRGVKGEREKESRRIVGKPRPRWC